MNYSSPVAGQVYALTSDIYFAFISDNVEQQHIEGIDLISPKSTTEKADTLLKVMHFISIAVIWSTVRK